MDEYFWSDLTTMWITREENFSVFVRNRVKDIRNLSDPWKYIPDEINSPDPPPRERKANYLASLKWWESPSWLKNPHECNEYKNFVC